MRWPMLTEMSVAKPWMEESPAPLMSQISGSVPGLEFSHATLLPVGPHGSAALAAVGPPRSAGPTSALSAATSASTTTFTIHARPRPCSLFPALLAISTPPSRRDTRRATVLILLARHPERAVRGSISPIWNTASELGHARRHSGHDSGRCDLRAPRPLARDPHPADVQRRRVGDLGDRAARGRHQVAGLEAVGVAGDAQVAQRELQRDRQLVVVDVLTVHRAAGHQ